MPQPNKIPLAFASSGDKNIIPESTETTGLASWRDGFPAITSAPFSEGGIAPKRADFNGIFNALSLATLWQQQGGFYEYDNATDYEVGNVVLYSGDLYKCLSANGPSSAVKAPTDATVWSKVMTSADVAALYLPLSGGTLSGNLKFSKTLAFIEKNTTDGALAFYAGNNIDTGAEIVLYGKDHSSTPGEFQIRAKDGTNSNVLRGYPDGSLSWDGKEVATIQTGIWTPTLYGETVAGSLTYSVKSGVYLKIGPLVYIKGTVTVSGYSTHPTGRAFLGGLPFTINPPVVNLILRGGNGQNSSFDKLLRAATNVSGSGVVLTGINESSNTFGDIFFNSSSTSGTNIQFSSSGSTRGSVVISGTYWSS